MACRTTYTHKRFYTAAHKIIASLLNRKLIICSSSLLNVRRLTISYALLFISQHFHAYSKMWLCFPALLCFALYHFHYDFSFHFFFCFCFLYIFLQIACYLVSPAPYFRFMRHLPDEHTHIIFCYTMNSEEHQMDSNTNALPQLPSTITTTTIKNEISAFFSSNAPAQKRIESLI